jgi:hypothetical protein
MLHYTTSNIQNNKPVIISELLEVHGEILCNKRFQTATQDMVIKLKSTFINTYTQQKEKIETREPH